eukprot:6211091-Pleurochrysis_carterae.AAC.3
MKASARSRLMFRQRRGELGRDGSRCTYVIHTKLDHNFRQRTSSVSGSTVEVTSGQQSRYVRAKNMQFKAMVEPGVTE